MNNPRNYIIFYITNVNYEGTMFIFNSIKTNSNTKMLEQYRK